MEHIVSRFVAGCGEFFPTFEGMVMLTHLPLLFNITAMKIEMNTDEKEKHDFSISAMTASRLLGIHIRYLGEIL